MCLLRYSGRFARPFYRPTCLYLWCVQTSSAVLTLKAWLFLIISFLIWYLLGFTAGLSKSQTLIFFLWISQEFFLMYFISVRRAVKGFLGRCCVCRGWLADQHAVTWWGWNAQARDWTQLTWGSYRVINSHFLSLPTCHTKQPILNK